MIPDEYQNETDYRKIPREHLESRIPQGREKGKWMPFASIPEQFEQIQALVEEQNKAAQPELSDDQCAMLTANLHFKIMNNEPATVAYWQAGYFQQIQGSIRKIDMLNNRLLLDTGNESAEIPMSQMVLLQS
ncbi:YolD-like family protein [Staphylococcus simulans]|uniref:YolD-like family protein n=1 Tax=Staphylococcus simulans TaxID=1286 RepID=UPI0021CEFDFD|nr:YolD-like family protein [Staphylococcus simulans]UXV38796.1 YolD-like family protein [Staphylococcus simulans]UXV41218.1 YolD-like family protein [Staphylococcus simulans]